MVVSYMEVTCVVAAIWILSLALLWILERVLEVDYLQPLSDCGCHILVSVIEQGGKAQ